MVGGRTTGVAAVGWGGLAGLPTYPACLCVSAFLNLRERPPLYWCTSVRFRPARVFVAARHPCVRVIERIFRGWSYAKVWMHGRWGRQRTSGRHRIRATYTRATAPSLRLCTPWTVFFVGPPQRVPPALARPPFPPSLPLFLSLSLSIYLSISLPPRPPSV